MKFSKTAGLDAGLEASRPTDPSQNDSTINNSPSSKDHRDKPDRSVPGQLHLPLKALALDVDNTLLDFDACAAWCMQQAFASQNVAYEPEMFDVFLQINNGLWHQIEKGELDLDGLRQVRWKTVFQALGQSCPDPLAMEDTFRRCLNESHTPIPGASEALSRLKEYGLLYVVSNGPQKQQEHRLELAGMKDGLQQVLTSESMDVKKPDPLFFQRAQAAMAKTIPDLDPSQILIIGDSLHADIQGARQAGWQTLWFHPGQNEAEKAEEAGYTGAQAADWSQVLQILEETFSRKPGGPTGWPEPENI